MPKQPRRDGQPCAGCGALTSSCWRGPGSQWCNEKCREKAKQARAALMAATKMETLHTAGQRSGAPDVNEDATYDVVKQLRTELKQMAVQLLTVQEQLQEQRDESTALREQVSTLAQRVDAQPKPPQRKRARQAENVPPVDGTR